MPETIDGVAKRVPDKPQWAVDPQASIPLGFISRTETEPDRFWLGQPGQRAIVRLADDWRTAAGEEWVGVAAGAYAALCGDDCTREMAELIAKGWISAAGAYAQKVIDAHAQLMARGINLQH